MSNLRRYYCEGNTYFVTTVTCKRQPILVNNIDLVWQALRRVKRRIHYELIAWAVMPDHLHLILDPKEADLSDVIKRIKLSFAKCYRDKIATPKKRVWQYRFWDHVIRDQDDLNRHIDYVHYNPVKHGLSTSPMDYPNTSFCEFLKNGFYDADWGCIEPDGLDGDFGD